jgi:hypothetical protein
MTGTMLRGLSVAVTDALNAWLAPPPVTGKRVIAPYCSTTTGHIYHYVISTATDAHFMEACRADLQGYSATWGHMHKALETWITVNGAPKERTVVIEAPTWTGHFVVSENTDATHTLVLSVMQ